MHCAEDPLTLHSPTLAARVKLSLFPKAWIHCSWEARFNRARCKVVCIYNLNKYASLHISVRWVYHSQHWTLYAQSLCHRCATRSNKWILSSSPAMHNGAATDNLFSQMYWNQRTWQVYVFHKLAPPIVTSIVLARGVAFGWIIFSKKKKQKQNNNSHTHFSPSPPTRVRFVIVHVIRSVKQMVKEELHLKIIFHPFKPIAVPMY